MEAHSRSMCLQSLNPKHQLGLNRTAEAATNFREISVLLPIPNQSRLISPCRNPEVTHPIKSNPGGRLEVNASWLQQELGLRLFD